jgi:hypothetical protein
MKKYLLVWVLIFVFGLFPVVTRASTLQDLLSAWNNFLRQIVQVVNVNNIATTTQNTVSCTKEAKKCPDGSYVSRTGPKCEFEKCPSLVVSDKTEEQIGFVKDIYKRGDKYFLKIDYIQWLTGQVAERTYREDQRGGPECVTNPDLGVCTPPNGYYIRNTNSLIRTFQIDPKAMVKTNYVITSEGRVDVSSGIVMGKSTNLDLFVKAFNDTSNVVKGSNPPSKIIDLFKIKINSSNRVVELEEVYRP